MIIEKFSPEHLDMILLQPEQASSRQYFGNPEYGRMLSNGLSYTAIDGGRILCCAGIIPLWDNRAEAWALMGCDLSRNFIRIHKSAKRFLDSCEFARVEAAVDSSFHAAKEWLVMLGFHYEGSMKKYTPEGRTCDRYARVR